jgi:hypothetical protein
VARALSKIVPDSNGGITYQFTINRSCTQFPITTDYPHFDKWLTKRFVDASASKKVVAAGHISAAFSM